MKQENVCDWFDIVAHTNYNLSQDELYDFLFNPESHTRTIYKQMFNDYDVSREVSNAIDSFLDKHGVESAMVKK